VWQATAAQRTARLELEKNQQQVHLSLQQGLDEIKAAQETTDRAIRLVTNSLNKSRSRGTFSIFFSMIAHYTLRTAG